MADRWSQRLGEHREDSVWWLRLRLLAALAAVAAVVLRLGWRTPAIESGTLLTIEVSAIALYAISMVLPNRLARRSLATLAREHTFETMLIFLAVLLAWWPPMLTAVAGTLALHQFLRVYMQMVVRSPSPSWVFLGTFGALITMGTLALMLPRATPAGNPIDLIDALFTATSAVCVTGLIVRDTGADFTQVGQTIILVLIQLGGLGIVVFGALVALAMGSSMGLRASRTFADTTAEGHARPTTIRTLIAFITLLTLGTELVGMVILYIGWPASWQGAPTMDGRLERAFHAAFFSISSFCNAGFSTTTNSLEGLRWHWTSQIVVASLVVIGGLGFPVLDNLRAVLRARWTGKRMDQGALVRLTLHTKLVLITTASLYLAGVLVIFLGRLTQGGESIGASLLDAHFMSVTARTAGFDTVDPGAMGPLSRIGLITFMFVGGSPGSTAGGVKTIVFAIIAMTIWATMHGKSSTEAFGRTIHNDLVRRAATLISLGAGTIAVLTMALAATDGAGRPIGDLLFEVVSASSTVGLTTGITSELSDAGRLILVTAMFFGRVGPLVMLVALASVGARRRPSCEYPTEMVVMS